MKTIQLPDAVYEEIAELAAVDKVSVDKMAAVLLHEHVGEWSKIQTRAARGSIEKLHSVLAKVPDVPSDATDRL